MSKCYKECGEFYLRRLDDLEREVTVVREKVGTRSQWTNSGEKRVAVRVCVRRRLSKLPDREGNRASSGLEEREEKGICFTGLNWSFTYQFDLHAGFKLKKKCFFI